MNEELKTFISFAKEHVLSGDIDPAYPVLRKAIELKNETPERAFYRLSVYLSFYDLGESDRYIDSHPDVGSLGSTVDYKKATERRSFRGNDKARDVIRDLFLKMGDFQMVRRLSVDPMRKWTLCRELVESVKFCGTWASYKFCDLLKNVLDFELSAPDLGLGGQGKNAGPIPGLVRLTGKDWMTCATDLSLQRSVYESALSAGAPFKGMEEFETSLCDFNSFRKGHYYVGHDIDSQMGSLKNAPTVYWTARSLVFEDQYLGEKNGWFGVRPDKFPRIES